MPSCWPRPSRRSCAGLGVHGRRHRPDRRRHRPRALHRAAGGGGHRQGPGPGPGDGGPRGHQPRHPGRGRRRPGSTPVGPARWWRWSTPAGARCSPPPTGSTGPRPRGTARPVDPESVRDDRPEPLAPDALVAWVEELVGQAGPVTLVGDGVVRYHQLLRPVPGVDLGWAETLSAPPPLALAHLARRRLDRRGPPGAGRWTWCPTTGARPTPGSTGSSGPPTGRPGRRGLRRPR